MTTITQPQPTLYAESFRRDGFAICDDVFTGADVDNLLAALAALPAGEEVRRKRSVYGVRNLLEICPAVRRLAADRRLAPFVTPVLDGRPFAVRATFFDKAADTNWSLGWHQDSVISVAHRCDVPGFAAWSQKAGVWQVQPPAKVLARMIAVRVHLDACDRTNGPLRVLPGSHRAGSIEGGAIDDWKCRMPQVVCQVGRGGIVTMCPLTLHASARSTSSGHRCVIHVEYAADDLPANLEWNTRVPLAE